ncbi:MAG: hypothetical protein JNK26_01160 [Candidatus Doudnabacteria bacterium]|nr:hypothetical protein [Candidatus Doudnabacteria bacterium]
MSTEKSHLKSQASIAIVSALAIILVVVSLLTATISVNQYRSQGTSVLATRSQIFMDAAFEEALIRLKRNSNYVGETYTSEDGVVIQIAIANTGVNERQVTVTTINQPVRRQLIATVSISGQANLLEDYAVFAGENVQLVKSSARLRGNLWSNDNVDLDEGTLVEGNVAAAGQGNGSNTSIRNGARVQDNPLTTEIEGNVGAIDRIRITNNGYVQNVALSKVAVNITSGGYAGQAIVNSGLSVPTIQIPSFKFDDYKQVAINAGTYYTTPQQFLNFLTLNGNTMSGGVHYIDSTSTLTFASGTTYNLTGTIISNGQIIVESLNYTHNAGSDLPAIAAKDDVFFLDQNSCDCRATVTGIIFSQQEIRFKHDQYSGPLTYAVNITGAAWAGDAAFIEDRSSLTVDSNITANAEGFNFTADPVPPGSDNVLSVESWTIN